MRNAARNICLLLSIAAAPATTFAQQTIKPLDINKVTIQDPFWSPRLKVWHTITTYDVFNKLEGKYDPDRDDLIKEQKDLGHTRNAFDNFDRVAQGKTNTRVSDGPPWYDGLVYETIRGAADLLVAYPDKRLEQKIDGYIDRIAAAQAADPDGYINTYTTLNQPNQRWGTNGGNDRWQHDMYNAGMLVEAGVHYFQATGKTKLLTVAVKMANYMCRVQGDTPKLNVIPGHAGPEEAFLKLYLFFKSHPDLKQQMKLTINEQNYFALSRYWMEHRGIYADADGGRKRESSGSYNQDQSSIFNQQTIEGHAVRATLLGTAIAATASYTGDARYAQTADNYWNNMLGKRTFVTGGQGAIADDEKFGDDYFLPESAYLETCAAIGSAFFSQRMNELKADGKYMDAFERVLYNNVLSGIALDGTHYHYENPLIANNHPRWSWHSCPCCPPMLLKIFGALPGYIYAEGNNSLYVNLFIGSKAKAIVNGKEISVTQISTYPQSGDVTVQIDPATQASFAVRVRLPGWATGHENPFSLYESKSPGTVVLKVNGKTIPVNTQEGYAVINRVWKKGDKITMQLPVQPRLVTPSAKVKTLTNKVAVQAGPLVYGIESTDNANIENAAINCNLSFEKQMAATNLAGTHPIAIKSAQGKVLFTAIPFFTLGNRGNSSYKVWFNLAPDKDLYGTR